jgi:hypothetical protein
MPNQLLGVPLHTIAMSGLSRVRTELCKLLVIPSLAPHPGSKMLPSYRLEIHRFDPIAEATQFTDHSIRAVFP